MTPCVVLFLIIVCILFYNFIRNRSHYWKEKGVPYVKPSPFFGNLLEVFTSRLYIGDLVKKYYHEFQGPYFGMYIMNAPVLVIKDLVLVKSILVQNFTSFCDRGYPCDEKIDSVSSNFLFFAKNPKWKWMRTKISPAFSSGKTKSMVPLIRKAAEDLIIYLGKNKHQPSFEARDLCAMYITDVVISCGFGIDACSFKEKDGEFITVGRKMFHFNWITSIRQTCYFLTPSIATIFKLPFLDSFTLRFMRETIYSSIERRRQTRQRRNDIIDTVMDIQNKQNPNDAFQLNGDALVAQASQLFIAGYETLSTTMSFAFYELCLHPHIQNKVRSEINMVLAKHGNLTYEALQDLIYLDMVVYETLRMHPVLPMFERICTENYVVHETGLIIEKGIRIYIPTLAIQHDAKYFSNPEIFDPERFSLENKDNLPACSFTSFGEGPRHCIGERLALLITKIGVASVLSAFEAVKCADTPVPIVYDYKNYLPISNEHLNIQFKKIT